MKRLWLSVAAGLIGLGILSGVSAAVTVHLLYQLHPEGAPVPTAAALAGPTSAPAQPPATPGTQAAAPPATAPPPKSSQIAGASAGVDAETTPSPPALTG